jgi:hypothetical protein
LSASRAKFRNAFLALLDLYWVNGDGRQKPRFPRCFFSTPRFSILVNIYFFLNALFLILLYLLLLLWLQGEKTRKATDGKQGWRSCSGIYSSDFWGKKKPGQMCTKMPFFNSYTVGCIPNSSCLINALASDCCCSRGWNVFHLTEPSDSGPTTPLPNKKLLLFVLDRLQK